MKTLLYILQLGIVILACPKKAVGAANRAKDSADFDRLLFSDR